MADNLIRFVTDGRHPPYGHRTGIFPSAYKARRENWLASGCHDELCDLLLWFSDNLPVPDRFAASRHHHAKRSGISWIRTSASDHMQRLRRIAALRHGVGIPVQELRTARPGYILYEDDFQIVALPFRDTPR
jgi:hypothetical protein